MRKLALGFALAGLVGLPARAAVLEVPSEGAEMSGALFVSGWKCPPVGEITIAFDDLPPLKVVTGVSRGDTATACKNDGDNGFIAQFNYAILNDPASPSALSGAQASTRQTHTAVAYDDGIEFARVQFHVTSFGQRFLRGAEGSYELRDFPSEGDRLVATWNQATQSFVITDFLPLSPTPTPTPVPAGDCPCFSVADLQAYETAFLGAPPTPDRRFCAGEYTDGDGQSAWFARYFVNQGVPLAYYAGPVFARPDVCAFGILDSVRGPNNCASVLLEAFPTCTSLGVP